MTGPLVAKLGAVCTTVCDSAGCGWESNGATWSPLRDADAVEAVIAHVVSSGHRAYVDRTVRTRVTPYGYGGPSVPLHDLDRAAS